ncbi:MAG: thiamine pyrophosphokinae [Actinomycetota bacterium]|nr:thiamine pyrophosphokinae [Actinomycetota bacterium]
MRVTRAAIVLAGGDPVEPTLRRLLCDDAVVVAADSGLHQAELLGLRVDFVVGDLDSADPAAVERARAAGAVVERHPVDKDATDLELALDVARARGARRITVVGGAGGRLDHFLVNVALLASPRLADLEIDARLGEAYVVVAQGGRPPHVITGAAGSLVTLLPAGGDACGITTEGLQYPLHGETLGRGTTRGVSNVLVREEGSVVLDEGTLLVIQAFGGAQ